MKEIKEDIYNWIDIPCSWKGRLNMVKISVLSNCSYRSNEISIKTPTSYSENINKLTQDPE